MEKRSITYGLKLRTILSFIGVTLTIIFLILPLGLYGIYLLAAKKLSLKKLVLSLPWLLTPLVLFGIYLFACGNAQRYFETNWLLNTHILEYMWNKRIHDFSIAIHTCSNIFGTCKLAIIKWY